MVDIKSGMGSKKDNFVVKIYRSFTKWAWEGFQVQDRWNNIIHPYF